VFDKQGQLINGTLADYLLPTAEVLGVEIRHQATPAPYNELGVKGWVSRRHSCGRTLRPGDRGRARTAGGRLCVLAPLVAWLMPWSQRAERPLKAVCQFFSLCDGTMLQSIVLRK
jgi:hypothetical protein